MKAETWKDVDAGRSVRSGEKWNICLVEFLDDVELVLDEFLPYRERIGIEVFDDSGGEFGPAFFAPEDRSIFAVGILCNVNRVDEPLTALPIESGALPGLIFCEELNQGGFTRRVVSLQEAAGTFRAFQQFVFDGRAALKNTNQSARSSFGRRWRLPSREPHPARGLRRRYFVSCTRRRWRNRRRGVRRIGFL